MNLRFEISDLKFDERGLLPAVVQDKRTREVLTLAYMNEESLRRTIETGETHFWSRSRAELWHKGATSGNTQRVVEMRIDCDGDALVVLVEPRGAACHTGARSCFVRADDAETSTALDENLGALLERLYALVTERREQRPEGSYTTYLFNSGLDKILKKIGEESAETIIAAKNLEKAPLVSETADLLFHLTVLLVERGVKLEDVRAELAWRHQRGSAAQ
jgi:phosphoribosyl-ATP pyrophosphohydrolase/phosphoribosyl-AMP cyclohydrolase